MRIHFHMNGVFNGCKKIEKDEILEVEALDCVHEMDTINHYVGMYPIAAGGVIERAFSPFLISMLGVMLLGFMMNRPAVRMGVLGAGFAVIAGWMYLTYYGGGGLQYQNEGYVSALVTALDQDTSKEEEDLSPGAALIARLKASMEESRGGGAGTGRRKVTRQETSVTCASPSRKTSSVNHRNSAVTGMAAVRKCWPGIMKRPWAVISMYRKRSSPWSQK